MQLGFCFSENVTVGFILAEKLGWNTDGTANVKIGYISTIAILTVGIGSLIGSDLIVRFADSHFRKMIYIGNILIIIVNCLKVVEHFWTVLIGRALFGLLAGYMSMLF